MRLNKILDISHMTLIGDLDLAIAIAMMAGMSYIGDDAARVIQDAVVGIQPYKDRILLYLDIHQIVIVEKESHI